MKNAIRFFSTNLLAVFSWIVSYSQNGTSEVDAVKAFVASVDSINNLGDQNNHFLHFIEDGVIAQKLNRKVLGGYGLYVLMDARKDTIYRIEYNGGVDFTINKTFYYRSNQIVFARIRLLDRNGTFYKREELYKGDAILVIDIKNSKKARKHKKDTTSDLFHDGVKYFEDFKKTIGSR